MRLDHLLLSKDSIVLSGVFTKYLHSENHVGQADVRVPFGALAQLGEHLLCKQGVVGSIPTGSTILGSVPEKSSGSVAQVVRAHP